MVVDVVGMRNLRAHLIEERAQLRARLQREDHPLRALELVGKPIAAAELDLVGDWTLYYFGNMEEWCDGIAPHALVEHDGVRVVIIDSLNGYMNAMPEERFLVLQMHELLSTLNQLGVVTILILAQHGMIGPMQTPLDISYLSDAVVMLRYFEAEGRVRRAISVVKKRSSAHEDAIREFEQSHVVGHDQDSTAVISGDAGEDGHDRLAAVGSSARIADGSATIAAGNSDALLLAAAQIARKSPGLMPKPDPFQHLTRFVLGAAALLAAHV